MNKLKFCANISMMFMEHESLLQRYDAAKRFGFKGVEFWFPYDIPLNDIAQKRQEVGVEQILINSYPGDSKLGECGLAALPGREEDFQKAMQLTMNYADALGCKRIHIMSGKLPPENLEREQKTCLQTLTSNLKNLLPELEKRGITGLIEPINNQTVPGYILNNYDLAISIIQSVNSPNIRLMMDFFHLQQIHGNLSKRIEQSLPYTGHIQIAQVPGRNEPDSQGEIDFQYVLSLLAKFNYDGWIGLEYRPLSDTETGLGWINKLACAL
ncbi:putative hydroxypyruvate isomerase, partial [Orchesella cincta]